MASRGSLQRISFLRTYTRYRGVFEYPAIQELHYIEWRAYDAAILAEAVRLGHRDIRMLQCMDYLIFPLYLMRSLRKELSRRFLAQDELAAIGSNELVSRIGLAKTELFVESLLALVPRLVRYILSASLPVSP